jgi:adenosylcobinamide-GDP ribazoletransferase
VSVRAFWLALGFLTRLPVPRVEPDEPLSGRSVLYYPLVGLILGAGLVGFAVLFPPGRELLAAALVLLLWVWFTGALHLDGLADSADAWLGAHGRSRERMLAIMKDPASGPAGVAAVTIGLVVKFAALAVLIEARAWLVLLCVPMLARAAVVVLFLTTPYVRPQGIGAAQARCLPRRAAAGLSAAVALAVPAVLGLRGLVVLAAAGVVFVGWRRSMMRNLGGTTGDTAGALIEGIECAALAAAAALS